MSLRESGINDLDFKKDISIGEFGNTNNYVRDNLDQRISKPDKMFLMSSFEERRDIAKITSGTWTGEVGNSKCIPDSITIKEELAKYDVDGIEYKNGIVDFTPVSEAIVKIEDMSEFRTKNYQQADQILAETWNKQIKDGRDDWTAQELKQYRKDNNLTWHEHNDMETCYLVKTEINAAFKHLGGVSECKKYNGSFGGSFDE